MERNFSNMLGNGSDVSTALQHLVVPPALQLRRDTQRLELDNLSGTQDVASSLNNLQELTAHKKLVHLAEDITRITRNISHIEKLVAADLNNIELRAAVAEVVIEAQRKFEQVQEFCRGNKSQQYKCRNLHSRMERERDRANRLQERLDDMGSDAVEGEGVLIDFVCSICTEKTATGFIIACREKHSFCAVCLAKCIHQSTLSNRAAQCPSCPHELHEKEVFDICSIAGEDAVASQYLERCMQRRVDAEVSTLWCPKGCGNGICSRLSNKDAVCDRCSYHFCPECFYEVHPTVPSCSMSIRDKVRVATGDERCRLQAELSSMDLLRREAISMCPQCKFICEKIDGCDSVSCAKCKCFFNFCLNRIPPSTWEEETSAARDCMKELSTLTHDSLYSASSSLCGSQASDRIGSTAAASSAG